MICGSPGLVIAISVCNSLCYQIFAFVTDGMGTCLRGRSIFFHRMKGFVYILTNLNNTTLYSGVTSEL